MRIIHVCDSIIGGTGTYLEELIPAQIAKYGIENVCFLIPKQQYSYLEKEISASSEAAVLFNQPNRFIGTIFLIAKYIACLHSFKPDIVHAHSSISGLIVRFVRLFYRTRGVFCPHGWAFDMKNSKLFVWSAKRVELLLSHLTDRIIVISNHEYQRAIDIGIKSRKLVLIPSGISAAVPAVKPAEWNDNRLKVLFAGRFDAQKGLDVLLEAVAPLGERVSLRVIGDFVTNTHSAELPDLPHVQYMGWQSRKVIAEQMKACDILVVPSRWEGFGLVAVEAMRLSVPVLASAVGGLKEILANDTCGFLVPSEDPAALRHVLLTVDKEELTKRAAAGHARFNSNYTADRMVHDIDDLYCAVVKPRTPSRNSVPSGDRGPYSCF